MPQLRSPVLAGEPLRAPIRAPPRERGFDYSQTVLRTDIPIFRYAADAQSLPALGGSARCPFFRYRAEPEDGTWVTPDQK